MEIQVIQGDITQLKVEVIVNAANTSLLGGGGVDGAIHRAGGPEILQACKEIGGCRTGEAVMTTAGNLPAQRVIHTVGPVWKGGGQNEEQLLANAYTNSLSLALDHGYKTIAFPNISTGVYGFPKIQAAKIAMETIKNFDHNGSNDLKVIFVCFDKANLKIYQELMG